MQAVWMILASFLLASMSLCVKFASAHFNSAELVFYRGLVGLIFMAGYARLTRTSLRTRHPLMHVKRSIVGVLSLSTWYYAIAHLPLATAVTLNYMSGVWMAVFLVGGSLIKRARPGDSPGAAPAAASLGSQSRSQGPLILAILASFAGVVMLLRPAIDQNQSFAGLIGLLSGLGAAFAYLQIMAISRLNEPEIRTVFYFALGTTVAGTLGMGVMGLSAWNWQHAVWLAPIGILASLGQLCMTKAYSLSARHGGTLMVANLQYSGIVFAALYSLVLFGDNIPLSGWAGMALIVASAATATVLRARSAPKKSAEKP